ncbi:alpha/beta fold hydrolase [Alkalibacillus almallahensis]|uniref:alpha/beta fold hydrolase n=1 Tax=Alkalibacillus almallahensis TaxID=1379154 RepID=UPI0014249291|nr:alpha/beta hydrolase [Alkalibacillus almallahensis]NIK13108.1 pimeloyl-ACP methyl ester carboxylesterase [Alkalibacillus almallahensis]
MPYITYRNQKLYYRIQGKGEAIVFIHCPVFPSPVFKGQIESLSNQYQVVQMDLRGHGRSHSSGEPWDFTDICYDFIKFIETKVQKRVWLVAYSAGCSIAFELALKRPDLVKGLIQIGAVDRVNTLILSTLVKGGMALTKRGWSHLIAFFGTFSNTKNPLIAVPLISSAFKTNSRDAYYFYRAYLTYQCQQRLFQLDQPTVLIYGEHDKLLSRHGASIASKMPNCSIRMVQHGRHQLPGNQINDVNQIIDQFIKSH